jgi:hypothetical protein
MKTIINLSNTIYCFDFWLRERRFCRVDGLCPEVLSTTPLNGSTNIPLDQLITATFNEEMNPETINQSSFTLNGTSQITGVLHTQVIQLL